MNKGTITNFYIIHKIFCADCDRDFNSQILQAAIDFSLTRISTRETRRNFASIIITLWCNNNGSNVVTAELNAEDAKAAFYRLPDLQNLTD